MSHSYLAQDVTINGQHLKGPLVGINDLGSLISVLLTFLIPLGGIILFLMLVWGGYGYILSRGDPEKLKTAKGRITTALIGFFLLIISYLIVNVLSSLFGLGRSLFGP